MCQATIREEKKPDKLEEIQSARKRFQKIGQSVLQDIHMPSREEQFDFFASNKFVQELPAPAAAAASTSATAEITQVESPETALLLQGNDGVETEYRKALYYSHEMKKGIDEKLFFLPSSKISKKKANDF